MPVTITVTVFIMVSVPVLIIKAARLSFTDLNEPGADLIKIFAIRYR